MYSRLTTTPEDQRVATAVSWIREHGGKTTIRDVITYKVAGCKNKSDAEALAQELNKRGLAVISEVTPAGGGPKSVSIRLS